MDESCLPIQRGNVSLTNLQVCPTGIDIRNGLQYECIGCAACIDACNYVMDKNSLPRGLIRYTTTRGLSQRFSARIESN